MKRMLLLSGLVVVLCAMAACSKQNGQNSGADNSPSGTSSEGSIALLNLYPVKLDNGAAWLMTELQNDGSTSIKAFEGKWTMTDDSGNKVAADEIRYTSDTPFITTAGAKTAHLIASTPARPRHSSS